jgi:antitoxin HicB
MKVAKPEILDLGAVEYPARVTKQREGGYLVEFPDLPGCLTEGDALGDALANAREALSGWLFVAIKHDDPVPAPTVRRGRAFHSVAPELDVAVPLLLLWARKRLGLTQGQAARTLGITQQAYRKFETPGKSNPTLRTLARISQTLGLRLTLRAA